METLDRSALHLAKLRTLLRSAAPQKPIVRPLGASKVNVELAVFADCPRPGLTTLVTVGFSSVPFSMWRGLALGIELTLTAATDHDQFVDLLGSLVTEEMVVRVPEDRRRIVEANGVWAPGYPPHLVFTTVVSASPQLMVTKKVGDAYVQWMSAVPIDDAELRRYDRNIPAFLTELSPESIPMYPRPPGELVVALTNFRA